MRSWIVGIFILVSGAVSANVDVIDLPQLNMNRASGPYCGINSLFLCLDALGIETHPEDYISPEFIGSTKGSSAAELVVAARHFGVH